LELKIFGLRQPSEGEKANWGERSGCVRRLKRLVKRGLGEVGLWPLPARRRVVTSKLNVREAYRLWSSRYAEETAITFLDEELAREMLQGLPCTRLLDAGCGTGRRIKDIPGAIGVDASPEMVAIGGARNVVTGDVREMPFAGNSFDMVWCRLVLGYLPDPLPAYRELARVCMPGGYIFVSDFHPDAAAAGHQRTFMDQTGTVHEIENYVHSDHIQLAAKAGLTLVDHRDGTVGPPIRHFYVRGVGVRTYWRDRGLKVVAAYVFRRPS
jgi:malonyl-CoA O-methyltransferase